MAELSDVDPLSPTYKGGMMTGNAEHPAVAEPVKKCDHICLLDDGHVERGEPHFYGYEIPSPRAQSDGGEA